MNKWLSFALTVISVESASAMQGVLQVAPACTPPLTLGNAGMIVVAGKLISPRKPSVGSPRKEIRVLMESDEKPVHNLLERAKSERRLLSLGRHGNAVDLQALNESDKHPSEFKLSKSNSGSSSPLSSTTDLAEEVELEESVTQAPPIISRRNTISS